MHDVIQRLRLRLGYTRAELAAKIGVTEGAVSHYETGRHVASPETVAALIRVCRRAGLREVSFDTFFGYLLRRRAAARVPRT